MKYFDVEIEYIEGTTTRKVVARDGEPIEAGEETGERVSMPYKVLVHEYDEDGSNLDTIEYDALGVPLEPLLEEIEMTHPAGEWQNNSW